MSINRDVEWVLMEASDALPGIAEDPVSEPLLPHCTPQRIHVPHGPVPWEATAQRSRDNIYSDALSRQTTYEKTFARREALLRNSMEAARFYSRNTGSEVTVPHEEPENGNDFNAPVQLFPLISDDESSCDMLLVSFERLLQAQTAEQRISHDIENALELLSLIGNRHRKLQQRCINLQVTYFQQSRKLSHLLRILGTNDIEAVLKTRVSQRKVSPRGSSTELQLVNVRSLGLTNSALQKCSAQIAQKLVHIAACSQLWSFEIKGLSSSRLELHSVKKLPVPSVEAFRLDETVMVETLPPTVHLPVAISFLWKEFSKKAVVELFEEESQCHKSIVKVSLTPSHAVFVVICETGKTSCTSVSLDTIFGATDSELRIPINENELIRYSSISSYGFLFSKSAHVFISNMALEQLRGSFTVEMWAFPTAVDGRRVIFSQGEKESEEIFIEIVEAEGSFCWRAGSRTAKFGMICVSGPPQGIGAILRKWVHLSLSYTGSRWCLMVNGTCVGTRSSQRVPSRHLGKCSIASSFTGSVREVRFWKYARDSSTVAAEMARPLTGLEPCLLAYYPLNDGFGTYLLDFSPFSIHGQLCKSEGGRWMDCPELPMRHFVHLKTREFLPSIAVKQSKSVILVASSTSLLALVVHLEDRSTALVLEYDITSLSLVFVTEIAIPKEFVAVSVAYREERIFLFASAKNEPSLGMWEVSRPSAADLFLKEDATVQSYFELYRGEAIAWIEQSSFRKEEPFSTIIHLVSRPYDTITRLAGLLPLLQEDAHSLARKCILPLMCVNIRAFRKDPGASGLESFKKLDFKTIERIIFNEPDAGHASNTEERLFTVIVKEAAVSSTDESFWLLAEVLALLVVDDVILQLVDRFYAPAQNKHAKAVLRSSLQYFSSIGNLEPVVHNSNALLVLCRVLLGEAAKRTSEKLVPTFDAILGCEILQETLFEVAVEKNIVSPSFVHYASTLLKLSRQAIAAAVSALRTSNENVKEVILGLRRGFVGSLIPAFLVGIPLLPSFVDADFMESISSLHSEVVALAKLVGTSSLADVPWVFQLVHTLTFFRCKMACRMISSGESTPSQIAGELFGGGLQTQGHRFIAIKSLLQGVGIISKTFEEMQRGTANPRFTPETPLGVLEREIMAAYCNIAAENSVLLNPEKEDMEKIFARVRKLRSWLLSQRQADENIVEEVQKKALLLCRFETVFQLSPVKARKQRDRPDDPRRWKRMFSAWKAMRNLRNLLSLRAEKKECDPLDAVTDFFQNMDLHASDIEKDLEGRMKNCSERILGFSLLKQLLSEVAADASQFSNVIDISCKALCRAHYLEGVEVCGSQLVTRLRGGFSQLVGEIVRGCDSSDRSQREAWGRALVAAFCQPMKAADYSALHDFHPERHIFSFCSCSPATASTSARGSHKFITETRNHNLRSMVFGNTLSSSNRSSSLAIEGQLTLRWNTGRGCCLATYPWFWNTPKQSGCLYYEVSILEVARSGSIAVGLGPGDYNLSRPPGWDANSCAFHGDYGMLFHENSTGKQLGSSFGAGDVIGCGIVPGTSDVFWTKNGKLTSLRVPNFGTTAYPLIGIEAPGTVRVNFGADPFAFVLVEAFGRSAFTSRSVRASAWDGFQALSLNILKRLQVTADVDDPTMPSLVEAGRGCLLQAFSELSKCRSLMISHPSGLNEHIELICNFTVLLLKAWASVKNRTLPLSNEECCEAIFTMIYLLEEAHDEVRISVLACIRAFTTWMHPNDILETSKAATKEHVTLLDTLLHFVSPLLPSGQECTQNSHPVHSSLPWEALYFLSDLYYGRLGGSFAKEWQRHVKNLVQNLMSASFVSQYSGLCIVGGLALPPQLGIVVNVLKSSGETGILLEYNVYEGFAKLMVDKVTKFISIGNVGNPEEPVGLGTDVEILDLVLDKAGVVLADIERSDSLGQCCFAARICRCLLMASLSPPELQSKRRNLVPLLLRVSSAAIPLTENVDLLQQREKILFTALARTQYRPRTIAGLFPHPINVPVEAASADTGGEEDTRLRIAQELSMRGFALDMCMIALEETRYDRGAALRLLTRHHEDLLHVVQRQEGSEATDDELSVEEEGECNEELSDDEGQKSEAREIHAQANAGVIEFGGGFVKIITNSPFYQFTLDCWVMPTSSSSPQCILHTIGSQAAISLELKDSKMVCNFSSESFSSELFCGDFAESGEGWTHLALAIEDTEFFLFKNGELWGTAVGSFSLLPQAWILGAFSDGSFPFLGQMKVFRMWSAILSKEDIQFALASKHCSIEDLVVVLKGSRDHVLCNAVSLEYEVTVTDKVFWLESTASSIDFLPFAELDLSSQNETEVLFNAVTDRDDFDLPAVCRSIRKYDPECLISVILTVEKQIVVKLATSLVIDTIVHSSPPLSPVELGGIKLFRNFVRLSVDRGESEKRLGPCIRKVLECAWREVSIPLLEELVDIMGSGPKVSVFESSHPCRMLTEGPREVHVPDQDFFDIFFDQRTSSAHVQVTFYSDQSLSKVIARCSGSSIAPFRLHSSRFFFDVRVEGNGPCWGYKMTVQNDVKKAETAGLLIRNIVEYGLSAPELQSSFDKQFELIFRAVCHSSSHLRRSLLVTLTRILRKGPKKNFQKPLALPLRELRRIVERQFRRELGAKLSSRFVQAALEFFMLCEDTETMLAPVVEAEQSAVERFSSKREELRSMYSSVVREGKERVGVEKVFLPEGIRVEQNVERSTTVWCESEGATVKPNVVLFGGKWYFEMKLLTGGDITFGILPQKYELRCDIADCTTPFCGVNGKTLTVYNLTTTHTSSQRVVRPWKAKDIVGVVADIDSHKCTFYLNGAEMGLSFNFTSHRSDQGRATAAVPSEGSPSSLDEEHEGFVLILRFGSEEGVVLNFGASPYEFGVPHKMSLPLDPANLSVGALLPTNTMKAFADFSAFLVNGAPIPPFYYDDENPFDEPSVRKGPAHVGLVGDNSITISLLEVENTGTQFGTVTANCVVFSGKWYYEVLLQSAGLMQFGWATSRHVSAPWSGIGVGDTMESWAVDVFRCVKWHNAKSSNLSLQKPWSVGDVLGCSIDLSVGQINFSINGKPVVGGTLSVDIKEAAKGISPAASLRPGNSCIFNFGSSAFRYKPDGYRALGVPDTWQERIDTFYDTQSPTTVKERISRVPEKSTCYETFLAVAQLIDHACTVQGRNIHQVVIADLGPLRSLGRDKVMESYEQLKVFCRLSEKVIPVTYLGDNSVTFPGSLASWFLATRRLILKPVRDVICSQILRETVCKVEQIRLVLNRIAASKNKQAQQPSDDKSLFGQTFHVAGTIHPRIFKAAQKFWSVVFAGEGAEDAGGPFREHLTEMCCELMSNAISLFVPTANNVHNTGECREAFVPRPSATSETQLKMFYFLGCVMGGAVRLGEPLNLFFPPTVWKYLVHADRTEEDLATVDELSVQCASHFRSLQQFQHGASEEDFEDTFGVEYFVTQASDGSVIPLVDGGEREKVTLARCDEFADSMVRARLYEGDLQLEQMRRGLLAVIPQTAVLLLEPQELEYKVCGQADFTVGELRAMTSYESIASDDKRIQYLWQTLEELTPPERRLFLRFVSGRQRLPVKLRVLPLTVQGDPNLALPKAATCFFALELPDYSSKDILKEKLLYAIANCLEIDTDFRAREFDEGEGPQLITGIDDVRPEDDDIHHVE